MEFSEERIELIESAVPVFALNIEPVVREEEGGRIEFVGARSSLLMRLHKAGRFQHPHVLEERGHRQVERRGKLGHRGCTSREALDHFPAYRMGERMEDLIQSCRFIRHFAKYLTFRTTLSSLGFRFFS